jgi:aminotransferase EvaB
VPIRVWSYRETLATEREETQAAIDAVLDSGTLILGEHVEEFERRFAAYCGVAHGIGVGNGTDALFLALKAAGIGPGDEVLTVANTAVPTVSAIASTGARARFVDIDPATYLMDPELIEAALTDATRCILAVHLFGQCADMSAIEEIARVRGLKVIEDCAQAHGAERGDRRAGSMSDLAAFSFYPTKILGGYGDGGMVVTGSDESAAKLRRLRAYGMEGRYYAEEHGYNSRLDELQAAILLKKLDHLDQYIERRREIARRYDTQLQDTPYVLPKVAPGNRHAYYLYVVRHPRREELLEWLREHDVFLNVSYPWPIHTMRGYAPLGFAEGDLPHTEQAAREIFSLPMFPHLGEDDQLEVCRLLKEFLAKR